MKKLNKKGVTLIELIVSFALVATAVIYFYQTLSTIYDLYTISKKETQEYVDKDYAMRIVDAYVNANGLDSVGKVCGKYIVCDGVVFTPGKINVITIKKGSKDWIKYHTVKKDTITPKIASMYASAESNGTKLTKTQLDQQLQDIFKDLEDYKSHQIESSLNVDQIIAKDSYDRTIHTYEKVYSIDEEKISDDILTKINQSSGTTISSYCNDKSWCDNVDVSGNNIKLFRYNTKIADMTYDITLEKDIIKIVSNGQTYTKEKGYGVKESDEMNKITKEIHQNGVTESILYYCADKNWCNKVDVENNNIILYRNNNVIANMTYSTSITLEKDITQIVSNGKKYTEEKNYGVTKANEINKLTEYFRKNGTIGISKYCDGKDWCNIVGTNTWEGETTVSLNRNDTEILYKIYKKDDVKKTLEDGKSYFYPVLNEYNNVIASSYAGTSTSYTFDKLFSSKAVKVCYNLWNDYVDDKTLYNTTVIYLVGEDGTNIPFYLDSNYTTQTEHGFLSASTYYNCNTFRPSVSNKNYRVKVKNIHDNGVAYYTVFTAVESIEEIN